MSHKDVSFGRRPRPVVTPRTTNRTSRSFPSSTDLRTPVPVLSKVGPLQVVGPIGLRVVPVHDLWENLLLPENDHSRFLTLCRK